MSAFAIRAACHHRTTVGWKHVKGLRRRWLRLRHHRTTVGWKPKAVTRVFPPSSGHHRTTVGWKLRRASAIASATSQSSSHHSGMETNDGARHVLARSVIIAPQWDGNLWDSPNRRPDYGVIIAPQWDGNVADARTGASWNSSSSHHSGMETSNKRSHVDAEVRHHRTTVGWKLTVIHPILFDPHGHHRTTVGWKPQLGGHGEGNRAGVIIAPQWDGNEVTDHAC